MPDRDTYYLQGSITLEWWHGDATRRGVMTIIVANKQDRAALQEFAEFVGAEVRGPVMRIVFPVRDDRRDPATARGIAESVGNVEIPESARRAGS